MFDYKKAINGLQKLHHAASEIPGYFKDQAAEFIDVGEYSLALDTIASAYLVNKIRMPDDMFVIFDHLAKIMKLDGDGEFSGVAKLRSSRG